MTECYICNGDARFCGCKEFDKITYRPPDDDFRRRYKAWAEARCKRNTDDESHIIRIER